MVSQSNILHRERCSNPGVRPSIAPLLLRTLHGNTRKITDGESPRVRGSNKVAVYQYLRAVCDGGQSVYQFEVQQLAEAIGRTVAQVLRPHARFIGCISSYFKFLSDCIMPSFQFLTVMRMIALVFLQTRDALRALAKDDLITFTDHTKVGQVSRCFFCGVLLLIAELEYCSGKFICCSIQK